MKNLKKRGFCIKGKPNEVLAEYIWLIEFCKKYELAPTIDTAIEIEDAVAYYRGITEVHNV